MSCSLINWFWMFPLSYYVWNCLPINFLSIYLPCYIRYNEFWNFTNTRYPVKRMPNLPTWRNETKSVHLHKQYWDLYLIGALGDEQRLTPTLLSCSLLSGSESKWQMLLSWNMSWLFPLPIFFWFGSRNTFNFLMANYLGTVLEYYWGWTGNNCIFAQGP